MEDKNNNGGWREHSKLVLNELERLNEEQEKIKSDIESNYNELKSDFTKVRELKEKVDKIHAWMEEVKEVTSSSQIKEMKEEVYRQKNYRFAFMAIIGFVQFLVTLGLILMRVL